MFHGQTNLRRLRATGFRHGLVGILAMALLAAASVPAFGDDQPTPDAATVAAQVKQWGVGKNVKMTLSNGEHLTGHIRSIGPDSFTVKVSKAERTIPYSQVSFIKDPPGPLTWILVGAAIVLVTVLIVHH